MKNLIGREHSINSPCQVQRLPGYQAPCSVLLRNRMAERFASINVYKDFPLRISYFNVYFVQTKVLLLYFKIFK